MKTKKAVKNVKIDVHSLKKYALTALITALIFFLSLVMFISGYLLTSGIKLFPEYGSEDSENIERDGTGQKINPTETELELQRDEELKNYYVYNKDNFTQIGVLDPFIIDRYSYSFITNNGNEEFFSIEASNYDYSFYEGSQYISGLNDLERNMVYDDSSIYFINPETKIVYYYDKSTKKLVSSEINIGLVSLPFNNIELSYEGDLIFRVDGYKDDNYDYEDRTRYIIVFDKSVATLYTYEFPDSEGELTYWGTTQDQKFVFSERITNENNSTTTNYFRYDFVKSEREELNILDNWRILGIYNYQAVISDKDNNPELFLYDTKSREITKIFDGINSREVAFGDNYFLGGSYYEGYLYFWDSSDKSASPKCDQFSLETNSYINDINNRICHHADGISAEEQMELDNQLKNRIADFLNKNTDYVIAQETHNTYEGDIKLDSVSVSSVINSNTVPSWPVTFNDNTSYDLDSLELYKRLTEKFGLNLISNTEVGMDLYGGFEAIFEEVIYDDKLILHLKPSVYNPESELDYYDSRRIYDVYCYIDLENLSVFVSKPALSLDPDDYDTD